MDKKLILIGAGGHSKSVIQSISSEYRLVGYIDEKKSGYFNGLPIISNSIESINEYKNYYYFICIGDNFLRESWFKKINELNLNIINVIDDTSFVSENSIVGTGNFIGRDVIVNPNVIIGNNNILNTRCLIEHECKIGNNCHISTNAVINGGVVVEDNVFLGSMSVVIGQKRIGHNSIIGAGSVVIKDIDSDSTYVGVPAKKIKKNGVRVWVST